MREAARSAHLNAQLPHSIAAFFVVRGKSPVTSDLGYSIVVDVTKAHRQFLGEYGLTSKDVPLVSFDPGNWEEPFSEYRG